ncbi:MAG: hypothetical protein WBV55_13520 [Candidatus Sulfotelmatobacter sp.]
MIAVLLLTIAIAPQPAFTAVGRRLPSGEPAHAPMVDVSADGGETVVVAMPFSSSQLNPSLVEYLGLNPTQVRSIQRLMDQERPKTEPWMLELRAISAKLRLAIQQNQSTDNEGTAEQLAATQARLLKQLMTANSRLQRRIDNVLDLQQRKKLDALKRTGEVTVGEGD